MCKKKPQDATLSSNDIPLILSARTSLSRLTFCRFPFFPRSFRRLGFNGPLPRSILPLFYAEHLFSHLRTRVAPYFKRHISKDHASSTGKMSMLAAGLPPLHHTAGLPLGVHWYRVTLPARHQLHINATSRYPETMCEMEERVRAKERGIPGEYTLLRSILVN